MADRDLRYAVAHLSSHEGANDRRQLEKKDAQGTGWVSKKFCTFPQEIVLRLERPSHVNSLSMVSHEFLIPKRVEVQIKLVDSGLVHQGQSEFMLSPGTIEFDRLGYVNFGSNEANNFASREMKSINIDRPCSYIKLLIYHNHPNNLNLFGQVGIAMVSLSGQMMIERLHRNEEASRSSQNVQQRRSLKSEDEQPVHPYLDRDIQTRLKILEEALRKAETNEDYPEAKILLEAYQNLLRVGVQMLKLEERKAIAVQDHDYDSAQLLKQVERAQSGNRVDKECDLHERSQRRDEQDILPQPSLETSHAERPATAFVFHEPTQVCGPEHPRHPSSRRVSDSRDRALHRPETAQTAVCGFEQQPTLRRPSR